LYREPLALETKGLGDTQVSYYAVRSAASAFGIGQLAPHAVDVPFLPSISAPVQASVNATTTAAFFQYVASGYVGATPTPGCVTLAETAGHYCVQIAAEARAQRVAFFTSALRRAENRRHALSARHGSGSLRRAPKARARSRV
jgi:cell division septation protein DedD